MDILTDISTYIAFFSYPELSSLIVRLSGNRKSCCFPSRNILCLPVYRNISEYSILEVKDWTSHLASIKLN